MKKVLAIILAAILVFSLAACSAPDSGDNGGAQQGGNSQNGNQNASGNNSSNVATAPPVKEPSEPFSPYGTWVWVGNEKFTMTLNEDGTAVFVDNAENSYINLYPRLQAIWMSTENTFTYSDGDDRVKVHLHVDDRDADIEFKISHGNGYYILDQGDGGYDFVRAENYSELHNYFLNGPIKDTWTDIVPLQVGETGNLYAGNGITLTLNKLEMDGNYDLKVFCTISAKTGVSSFDWINWTLYNKGAGSIRSDRLYFYDLNGQEVDGLSDGQSVDGYFVIESVDEEQSMAWYGCLKAGLFISGMNLGEGCAIILPERPTV